MDPYKSLYNQTIAGTSLDRQGEELSRETLENWVSNQDTRSTLYSEHDRTKPIGYIENLKVVPDTTNTGHFLVKADVHIWDEYDLEEYQGFSISFTDELESNVEDESLAISIFLPYPFYTDESLRSQLLQTHDNVVIGRFVKKSLWSDSTVLTWVGIGISLLSLFKDELRSILPRLTKVLEHLRSKNISAHVGIVTHNKNKEELQVLFLSDEKSRKAGCQLQDHIDSGLETVASFEKASTKLAGIKKVTLVYSFKKGCYQLYEVSYYDGTQDFYIVD